MTLRSSSAIPGDAVPGLLIPGDPGSVAAVAARSSSTVTDPRDGHATVT